MCAIIGWAGPIPPNLLKQLYTAAEHRGRDSTGLAFRSADGQNLTVRQAVPAKHFVRTQEAHVSRANQAALGLGHTRRASSKMPVDNHNAHPYIWESCVFAHNGFIKNWKVLRAELLEKAWLDNAERRTKYLETATTDSMVLGPFIEELNFSQIEGSMGLIWMEGAQLFCLRSAKELTAAKVCWQNGSGTKMATVVASTWEIVEEALAGLTGVEYTAEECELAENVLYEIRQDGPSNEGAVLTGQHVTDKWSSKVD